ncbi:MAG TPA: O-methyltransferase [Chitinophagaceae bacterium]|nr:O-methyltransferase [Chitinophagaceae bacterium]
MELILPAVEQYAEKASSPESALLQRINRETHEKIAGSQMLSGHLQGTFLSMLSQMIRPKRILEIGTYTGYSAICLAKGLLAGGLLHTIDLNGELTGICRQYFEEAGLQDKIIPHIGNALDILPGLTGPFDLVFIDADKVNYSRYYDLIIEKVPAGGFILADNMLFHGEVLDPGPNYSEQAEALMAFSRKVQLDNRVEQILVTIRDGLLLVRKIV